MSIIENKNRSAAVCYRRGHRWVA